MEDFKKLDVSDDLMKKVENWVQNKKFIDCEIHGKNVEATTLGNCCLCRKDKENMTNEAKRFEKLQEYALVPPFYRTATFDNYLPTCDKAKDYKNRLLNYDYKSNMLFIGSPGTGKTHLACALLNQAVHSAMSGMYVPFYRAMKYKITQPETFNKVISCDFLVIDEFGVQDSISKRDLLQEIIDERCLARTIDNFKATVIISNLPLSPKQGEREEAKKNGIELPLYFVDAVADATKSRLKQSFTWVDDFSWDDYRVKKVGE